jgi:hypothetical protein
MVGFVDTLPSAAEAEVALRRHTSVGNTFEHLWTGFHVLSVHSVVRRRHTARNLILLGVPKTCIFCGGRGRFSKEHVLPEWAARLLNVGRMTIQGRRLNDQPRTWQSVGSFGQTVNQVCARCNNEWMSELEELARPILSRLIKPTAAVDLSPDDQVTIVAWLWKLAIVHEHITRVRYFTVTERRRLIRLADPPSVGVHVWIGYYSGNNAASLRGGLATFGASDGRTFDAYLLSMSLRRFAAQLLCFRPLPRVRVRAEIQYDFTGFERRIWPNPDEAVHWPPRSTFTEQLFDMWHRRWSTRR